MSSQLSVYVFDCGVRDAIKRKRVILLTLLLTISTIILDFLCSVSNSMIFTIFFRYLTWNVNPKKCSIQMETKTEIHLNCKVGGIFRITYRSCDLCCQFLFRNNFYAFLIFEKIKCAAKENSPLQMKFVIWIIIVAYELWIVRNCVHVMHIILWMIAHEYHRHATHRLWEHINCCSGARFSVAVYINGFVWIWCRFVPVLDYTCIFASLPQSLDLFFGPAQF